MHEIDIYCPQEIIEQIQTATGRKVEHAELRPSYIDRACLIVWFEGNYQVLSPWFSADRVTDKESVFTIRPETVQWIIDYVNERPAAA